MKIAVLGPCTPTEFLGDIDGPLDDLPLGLVGTPINALVRGLLDLGHEVHLISASPDLSTVWRGSGPQLSMSVVPYRARARDRALDLFREERNLMAYELSMSNVDVVSAHWSYEFGWVGVRSDKPCVLSVHDAPLTILKNLPDAYRFLRTLMAYRVRFAASRVTAVSPYLAKKWRLQMLYKRPISVIPNITPVLASITPKPSRKRVIVDIADSGPLKNVRRLVEAFYLFSVKSPGYELRLIGAGLDSDGPLALWARKQGLDQNVLFLGKQTRSQISLHLAEASVFCHPSLEESQPMCLLEAMSADVPVVGGYRAGGVPWTLDGGAAGLLVDVTKAQSIAAALEKLHGHPEIAERLIERGRQLVANRHSARAVASAYVEEFGRLIDKN